MKQLRALTPAELASLERRLRNPEPGGRIEAATRAGVDLTLVLDQLRLSPAERVARMLRAAEAAHEAARSRTPGTTVNFERAVQSRGISAVLAESESLLEAKTLLIHSY